MGFLSKFAKKIQGNKLAQMLMPMALTYAMGPMGGAMSKAFPMFSGMSPLMANALKQTALGYGTAALSGSKRPWKGAMYAGLTSIPFSYMSAARAADAFNQEYAGTTGMEKYMSDPGRKAIPGVPQLGYKAIPAIEPKYGFREIAGSAGRVPRMSAWDIATGKAKDYKLPPQLARVDRDDPLGTLVQDPSIDDDFYGKIVEGKTTPLDADIFTKTTPGKVMPMDKFGNVFMSPSETKADWLPTAASQAAALYGGMATPEEEWAATKEKRKKELAWMYGVDPDLIEGEMDNPWYTGQGYFNSGGIASLNNGGNVSGPGTGTSDSIDAKLSDGEFVMTAKAVENLGNGDRMAGARKMYDMMNVLDPESETMQEVI